MTSHKLSMVLIALGLSVAGLARGASLNLSSGSCQLAEALSASSKSSTDSSQSSPEQAGSNEVVVTVAARDEAARWLASGGRDAMSPLLRSTVDAYARRLQQVSNDQRRPSDPIVVRRMLLYSEGSPASSPTPPPAQSPAPIQRSSVAAGPPALASSSQRLYSAEELLDMGRFDDAIRVGLQEVEVGKTESNLVVGLAACRAHNASVASAAYRVADFSAQSQIKTMCRQSGYAFLNGSFRFVGIN